MMRDATGREISRDDVIALVPRGWRPLVGRLVDDLLALGWDGEVRQVKEKFGTLRFDVGRASVAVDARIAEAEGESGRTCEICDKPGESVEIRHWTNTLCAPHRAAVDAGKAAWQIAQELDRG